MSFLPQQAFRLFGKHPKDAPSFVERLQKLYSENDYSGIVSLGKELVEKAGERDSHRRLKNAYLFPLLSDMTRVLSKKPEYVGDAISFSAEIIGIIKFQEDLDNVPVEDWWPEAKGKEKDFLLGIAENLQTDDANADLDQKFRIYACIAEKTLDGAFPSQNSIPDWKDLCNKMMASATAKDLPRAAQILSRFASKDTTGKEEYSFPLFLKEYFDDLVILAKKSLFPEHLLATMAVSVDLPPKWDGVVRDILDKKLETMLPDVALDYCVKWSLQVLREREKAPTAAFLIEKVLEGIQNPDLVPDRKAFEKAVRRKAEKTGCTALLNALDDLRREETDIQSPHPTKAGVEYFLKTRGVHTLHK